MEGGRLEQDGWEDVQDGIKNMTKNDWNHFKNFAALYISVNICYLDFLPWDRSE